MKTKYRLSPRALLRLPEFKAWRRVASAPVKVERITLCGDTVTSETVELRPHDDRDSARGVIGSGVLLIVGYAVLALLLTACGGGGGGESGAAEKPTASAPPPSGSNPPASPPPATVEPGAFKTGSRYCLVLGADAACRIGESDSTWLAAADVNAARIAPVHVSHLDGVYTGTLDGVDATLSVVGATVSGQASNGCTVNGSWIARGPLFEFTGSASCEGGGQPTGIVAFVSPDGSADSDVRMLLAARGGSDSRITFTAVTAPNPTPTPTDCSSRPKPASEIRFTVCPSNTGPGAFTQTRVAVCSSPPEWSWSSWLPAQPSASECPPIVAPPPTCGAKPVDGVRTVDECPAGLQGTWEQRHTWTAVAYPTCWTPTDWTPDTAPPDACDVPPDPVFGMHGRWGWEDSAEFCDITPDGSIECVLSYNSAQQIMSGSVLPDGVGTTRSFRDSVFGPQRTWQFLGWSADANGNRLTLVFGGAGAPPGAGVLADMKRVTP